MSILNKKYTINKNLKKQKKTKIYKKRVKNLNLNFNVKKRKF
jgi:hypothetical protein